MQTIATLPTQMTLDSVQQARRQLVLFFAILVPLSALLEGVIIVTGQWLPWVIFLMWMPALASVIARIVQREGFRDVSFRLGGWRGVQALGVALVVPAVVGVAAYGLAWSTGLAQLTPPASATFPAMTHPLALLGLQFVSTFGIGFLISLVLAAGEEIGWRGYMLTRLIDARVPQAVLVSGLVWGAWHLPLILSGLYAVGPDPLLSVLLFMAMVTVSSFLYARLRLSTGSIWPAIMLHGAWNSTIQDVFDVSTSGAKSALWIGESGILVMLVVVGLVVLLNRVWQPTAALATDK